MERLSLRAMTVDEFDVFLARSVRGFAAEQVVSGKWSAEEAALHGVSTIGMNVFGWNSIARSLYEKAGYQIMSMQLRKEITTSI